MVGNIEEGIINVNYKVIIKVLIEVYFKVITKRSATFVTATQSIEALAQYMATMQACTIGSLWTRISR